MTPTEASAWTCAHPASPRWTATLAFALTLALPVGSVAQINSRVAASAVAPAPAVQPRALVKAPTEQGIRWNDVKPAQQVWLKPLEQDWSRIDAAQKQKWLQVATGFPKLSAPEQARVQARMADWAKLTPQERGQARLNFQEATLLPAQDRQARWDAYQALSPEQKQRLAARAAPGAAASSAEAARKPAASEARTGRVDKPGGAQDQAKSNIVPDPALASRPKAVSPTVVQASPGATTTTISKRPMPPSHQQTGMPKIAATPEFVDKETLLPQRGPQGAAIHSEPASNTTPAPRQ